MDNYTLEDVLVFKTNIRSLRDVDTISRFLSTEKGIKKWNVDLHDIDCVLRVESVMHDAGHIISLVGSAGFEIEELID